MGLFQKISSGLKKTRDSVISQINSMLHSFTKIDEDLFEELNKKSSFYNHELLYGED